MSIDPTNFANPCASEQGYVNIRDFGAVGDGSDATRALQQAVDTGCSVLIPAGLYTISATVKLSGLRDVRIFGEGTLTYADGTPTGTAGVQMLQLDGCANILIENLFFDGNKANLTQPPPPPAWNSGTPRKYYTPVDIQNSSNVTVQNCEFVNVSTTSVNFQGSSFVRILNNSFADSYMDPIFTITPDNDHAYIVGNTIQRIHYQYQYGNGMIVDSNHVYIALNTIDGVDRTGIKPIDRDMRCIVVIGNQISNCVWHGINPQGGSSILIADNVIHDVGLSGIYVAPFEQGTVRTTVRDITISDNLIYNTGMTRDDPPALPPHAINTQAYTQGAVENLKISGNSISQATQASGIRLNAMVRTTVENNQIQSAGVNGILLDGNSAVQGVDVNIRGNSIFQPAADGIRVTNAQQGLVIAGNLVSGPCENGIRCDADPRGFARKIEANTVGDVSQSGIEDATDGTLVANNVVEKAAVCYTLTNPIFINNVGKRYTVAYSRITGTADTRLD